MVITGVDALILGDASVPDEETVLVSVNTDEGVTGYGEAVASSRAVQAVVESQTVDEDGWDVGVRTLLLGEDPADPARLWLKLRANTPWSCRSGIGHVALAGVDMALWDLAGKWHGVPAWRLMGEQRNPRLVPYATLYHGPGSFQETLTRTLEALEIVIDLGIRAVKVESMRHNVPDPRDTIELVARTRERVGSDFPLLLDMGYSWPDFAAAAPLIGELDKFSLFALEAAFPPDRLDDYKRLAEVSSTPLASGDVLTAASDYRPLLDSGTLSFVQGGSARTGISDMGNLANAARARGVGLLPWGWVPTGLATAANIHRSVVHDNIALIEYRPPALYGTQLRSCLATPEPAIRDGEFELPSAPGLGVEVDLGLVDRLRQP
jgi:L-rhamnonate dehydratase